MSAALEARNTPPLEETRQDTPPLSIVPNKPPSSKNYLDEDLFAEELKKARTMSSADKRQHDRHIKIRKAVAENEALMTELEKTVSNAQKQPTAKQEAYHGEHLIVDELQKEREGMPNAIEKAKREKRKKIIDDTARASAEHTAERTVTRPNVQDFIREYNDLALNKQHLNQEEKERMQALKKAIAIFKEERDIASLHADQVVSATGDSATQAQSERYTHGGEKAPLRKKSEQIQTNAIAIRQAEEKIALLEKKNSGFLGRIGRKKRNEEIEFLSRSVANMKKRVKELGGRMEDDMSNLSQEAFGRIVDLEIERQKRERTTETPRKSGERKKGGRTKKKQLHRNI